nr:hypothetical protein [Actinoplanes subtropicus]
MGGVVDELPLRAECLVQPAEHGIDGVREIAQLVLRAGEVDASGQVGGLDLAGGPGDRPDGAQHPPGEDPADAEADHEQAGKRDHRVRTQRLEGVVIDRGLDLADLGDRRGPDVRPVVVDLRGAFGDRLRRGGLRDREVGDGRSCAAEGEQQRRVMHLITRS